jgi:hypothetical protein
MNPEAFASLLAEYGPPSEIAAGLAGEGAAALADVLLPVSDLRRFELPSEAAETISLIAGHLVRAQELMAALPRQIKPEQGAA